MVKYKETLYGRHTALTTSFSEVNWKSKRDIRKQRTQKNADRLLLLLFVKKIWAWGEDLVPVTSI